MSGETTDLTRTAYDTVAVNYAEMVPDTRYEADVDLAMVRHFVESLAPRPAAVLDAGCGTGRMIGFLGSVDSDLVVAGSDLSPSMLEVARSAYPSLELVVADNADLPFDDERFDGVLAWYSTIHTPPHRLGSVLAEFRRVLRRGGMLLLGFQAGTGERRIDKPYGHDVELTAYLHHTPYVRDALGSAGFAVTTVLDRAPRSSEKHEQGFVLATKE
ncbi:class I SAM-dependent DNA methyltransferase [Microbacterium sp. CPCC 204701]|uniref:class I SAM-dependent DNA methyltransferase n=1 Tax=Microbacterium sp. CPCC 204701 TaxID=2493084 RepID=UPI0013E3A98E|nr:class I SAM-dependent methyltransferase [Microbacterium sp. CPCC 204701]